MTDQSESVPLEAIENSADHSVAFVYPSDEPDPANVDATSVLTLFWWIRQAGDSKARDVRMQAVYYLLMGGQAGGVTQEELAQEVGVLKATVNKQVCALRDYLSTKLGLSGTFDRIAEAAGMRSPEARQTFSEVCKANHQKRKASLVSTESQTT